MPSVKDLSPDLLNRYLVELFALADTNGNGVLEKDEFVQIFSQSGFNFSEATINMMFMMADLDGDGVIEQDEFVPYVAAVIADSTFAPEPQAQKVKNLALKLFVDADQDDNGVLDDEELAVLLNKLFAKSGTKVSGDLRVQIVSIVRDAMGDNESLNFGQFCRLFQRDPWRNLLPKEAIADLPFQSLKYNRQQRPVPAEIEPTFVVKAQDLFAEADVDESGGVDQSELVLLLMRLVPPCADTGEHDAKALQKHARVAMDLYSTDGLVLGFDQFLHALSVKPLLALLPAEMRDHALMASAGAKCEPVGAKARAEDRSPGKRAFTFARKLFDEFDADGNEVLDEDELVAALLKMYERCGNPMSQSHRFGIVEQVRKSMSRLGVEAAEGITFQLFCRLVCLNPWRELMDPEMLRQLPFIVSKALVPQTSRHTPGDHFIAQLSTGKRLLGC